MANYLTSLLPSWLRSVRTSRTRPCDRRVPGIGYPEKRKLSVENLEDRLLLAFLTEVGSTLQITLDNTNESVGIVSAGGSYALTSTHAFLDGGITAGRVTFSGTSATVTADGLAAYDTVQIADRAGTQGTKVTFNDSGANVYSESFVVTLDQDTAVNAGEQSVVFNGASRFEAFGVNVSTTRNIIVGSGARISTTDGAISLSANAAGSATGNFVGMTVTSANITSTGAGAIQLIGKGGSLGGGGIRLLSGSRVSGGSTGTAVSMNGTGGVGGGFGVWVDAAPVTGSGTAINSSGGSVEIVGLGGGSGTGGNHYGVYLWFGSISAGGDGSVSVSGTGGNGSSSSNHGVLVDGAGATITSNGGPVQVIGRGGAPGASSIGVSILAGQVSAGGIGQVTIVGSGGGLGSSNYGVRVASIVTSSGGPVRVTGQGGGGTGVGVENVGVLISVGGQITAAGSGTVRIDGNGGLTTSRNNYGVQVSGTVDSSGGAVDVNGRGGGGASASSDRNFGVYVAAAGRVTAGGEGTVAVTGTGGLAGASSNDGVRVDGAGAIITSSRGAVQVIGQGGGSASTNSNYGVRIAAGGQITAGDTGSVTVDGSGGVGNVGFNFGVSAEGTGTRITSSGGAVQVTGQGGGSGSGGENYGVFLSTNSQITAGGTGSVMVVGAGGSNGPNNYGVWVVGSGSMITSSGGAVQVTGQGGGAATTNANYGVRVSSSGQITPAGSGAATVEGTGGPGFNYNYGVSAEGTGARVSSSGGDVQVTGLGGGSGSGGDNFGVTISAGSLITAGAGGRVTVQGTGGDTSGSGNLGVKVAGDSGSSSSTITSSGGSVLVIGQGGGSGSSANNYGTYLYDGGQITAGASGDVTVRGAGGSGSGAGNQGVRVEGGSYTPAITSGGGAVSVTGQGGAGSGQLNAGVVVVARSRIAAGASGATTVRGDGGSNSGGSSFGVWVDGSGSTIGFGSGAVNVVGQGGGSNASGSNFGVSVTAGGAIASSGGSVTVHGAGGGIGANNSGVRVDGAFSVIGTGAGGGAVQVTGQGGGSGSSGGNRGVDVGAASQIRAGGPLTVAGSGGGGSGLGNDGFRTSGTITSNGGNVQVTGTPGNGGNRFAISIPSGGTIFTDLNGGDITLIGDSMDFQDSNVIHAGSRTVTLKPKTTDGSVGINIGGPDAPGALGLTQVELRVGAGTLNIGHDTSGTIEVLAGIPNGSQGDWWINANTNVHLISGSDINFGGSIRTFGGSLILDPGVAGSVRPTGNGVDMLVSPFNGVSGALSFMPNSNLRIDIDGFTVDSQYAQLNVEGFIDLTGANLVLSGAHSPAAGQTFVIVKNDGTDAINGTFTGLPEGATIANFLGSGLAAAISYVGGTGNDVVLTVMSDADGVIDAVEDAHPNGGDGNNDGVADSEQENVASLPNSEDGSYVTLESPAGTELGAVAATTNPSPSDEPEGVDFPIGFLDFAVQGVTPGAITTVELIMNSGTPVNTYYKFGPTPDDPATLADETQPHWYEFLFDGTTGAEISGNVITLHFADGQRGDDDLNANGVIVDPGAPAFAPDTTTPSLVDVPDSQTLEATGPAGAVAMWSEPTASDLVDGSVAVSCSSGSGDTFALGTTTVTCSASDAAGNSASTTFEITVEDTSPPSLADVPGNQTLEATGPAGAVATWSDPTVSDIVNGPVSVSCSPESGSTFALGTTAVTCSATDTAGNSASVTFDITVEDGGDTTPPLAAISGPAIGVRGQPRRFVLSATDSASDETAGVSYQVDWGDGTTTPIDRSAGNGAGTPVDHIYAVSGTYSATVTATDQNGNVSVINASATQQVTISAMAVQPDPLQPSGFALAAGGRSGNDVLFVSSGGMIFSLYSPTPSGIEVTVGIFLPTVPNIDSTYVFGSTTIHIVMMTTPTPFSRFLLFGQADDDVLYVGPFNNSPAEINGGDGKDFILGGAGADILLGGDGDDIVIGGNGRDFIVGGMGSDQIAGDGGEDLLIAGFTAHDDNWDSLRAIRSEWNRTDLDYAGRIDHLRGVGTGIRLNGEVFLTDATVFDDHVVDRLVGGAEQDWFFSEQSIGEIHDIVIDRIAAEIAEDLGALP